MNSRNEALVRLGYKAARSRAFRNSDDFFDEFTSTLTNMGGVYAKFLQGVLLGYAVNKGKKVSDGQFAVYEDNPDPNLSPTTLSHIMGSAATRVKLTSYLPIGVGSYSAVYTGLLDGDKPVIVKVLRPEIHNEIRFDLKFLKKLTYLLRIAGIKIVAVDITQFYGSFKAACLKETDFLSEIKFASEMYERYRDHKTIVVPKTYTELSNEKIIIQERIDGLSAKTLVEARVKNKEDIERLTKDYYNTDLRETMMALCYELFYSFLSGKTFHGDLHPGNIRILQNNRVAMLDYGIKAEPYKDIVVPAVINKLQSDAMFLDGDIDIPRILDAHFRLYMSSLYASIESVLHFQKIEIRKFFEGLAGSMGIGNDQITDTKRKEWLMVGPATMLNDMLNGGSERFGIEVRIKDQSTQRAITTMFSLMKAMGLYGPIKGIKPVYDKLIPKIKEERPELFANKKVQLPDQALENIYGWLERLNHTNPEAAQRIRKMINNISKQTLQEDKSETSA